MRIPSSLTVALLTVAQLVAQERIQEGSGALRRRAAGVVVDADATPVVGARVTLLSRPWPGEPRIESADRIEVTTGERGRFNARVLAGRAYSAWAFVDEGDDAYRVSDISDDVFAGRTIRLRVARETRRILRVHVVGAERWRALAPLRYELLSTSPQNVLSTTLAPDSAGFLVLPRLPGDVHELRVSSEARVPIAVVAVAREDHGKKRAVALRLPAPRPILVRVKGDSDEPVASAALWVQVGSQRFSIGKTDSEGWATVTPPAQLKLGDEKATFRGKIWALSPSSAERSGSLAAVADSERDLAAMRKRGEPDLSLELQKGGTVEGRVLGPDGEPARRLPLLLWSPVSTRKGSYSHSRDPVLYRTDDRGRFRLVGRHPRCNLRLCAVLPEELLARLPSKAGFPASPVVWLHVGGGPAEDTLDLGDLALSRLEAVDVDSRGPDGGPVEFPTILIGTTKMHPFGGIGVLYPMELMAGRRGKLRVFLPKTPDLALGVLSPIGFAGSELAIPPSPGDPELSPIVVRLAEGQGILGRVARPDGTGIEAAQVRVRVSGSGSEGATRLLGYASSKRIVGTDAEGRFRLTIGSIGQYSFSATVRIGERSYRTRNSVRVSGSDGATHGEVELEIDAPPGKGERQGARTRRGSGKVGVSISGGR